MQRLEVTNTIEILSKTDLFVVFVIYLYNYIYCIIIMGFEGVLHSKGPMRHTLNAAKQCTFINVQKCSLLLNFVLLSSELQSTPTSYRFAFLWNSGENELNILTVQ